jgi:hypothetical protein
VSFWNFYLDCSRWRALSSRNNFRARALCRALFGLIGRPSDTRLYGFLNSIPASLRAALAANRSCRSLSGSTGRPRGRGASFFLMARMRCRSLSGSIGLPRGRDGFCAPTEVFVAAGFGEAFELVFTIQSFQSNRLGGQRRRCTSGGPAATGDYRIRRRHAAADRASGQAERKLP